MVEKKNCIKLSGLSSVSTKNAEHANGVYYPYNGIYKHGDHNNIYLDFENNEWKIFYQLKSSTSIGVFALLRSQDILDSTKNWYLNITDYDKITAATTQFNLSNTSKAEYIGALYMPEPGDEKIIDPIITPLDEHYTLDGTPYSVLGTIYKSIHHDFIYKYYNHTHKILFSDCHADYDIDDSKLNKMTDGMFPFIRLYKNNAFDYTGFNAKDIIYEDALDWFKI